MNLPPPPQSPPQSPPRILVACIGNIFLGDDAFGVRVAEQLRGHTLGAHVRVVDFGIRGIDLTYALLDGCDLAILVDAVPRGEPPGTLYVIEPELSDRESKSVSAELLQGHSLDPLNVLRHVRALGGQVRRVLILGCEPSPFDPDQQMSGELSPPVARSIQPALQMLESLVCQLSADPFTLEVRHENVESIS